MIVPGGKLAKNILRYHLIKPSTHFRPNKLLPYHILEKSNFNFRYVRHSALSDLGLHCLPVTLWVSRLK